MASFWSGIFASRWVPRGWQIRTAIGRLHGYARFWRQALSQPLIDLSLRTHAGLITRIVENPGLSLSHDALAHLVAQLRIVAGRPLPDESLGYGIFSCEWGRIAAA